ncbi:KTSC domain-containing protein [Microvirga sp. STS02]|jgi:KTSC domain|uniref:KTSC domain-containing protein n=1 Tax=Hymenobacter negativus TaxID=2795026 RepID=UPI0018DCA510|nr:MULTISPECIES: KTSC domain-containing protein [Bacteria]MBH8571326.1 KTSC domain-containing protein [Hymenobacter negativus]MBR7211064.1 KTSC domain-containing protein [Microvirga sp. STS02]
MERTRVRSSNISSIGYEASTGTLEVEFHSGSIYQYSRVPERVHEALMRAGSHGAYFNDHVRDSYSTRQVR